METKVDSNDENEQLNEEEPKAPESHQFRALMIKTLTLQLRQKTTNIIQVNT